MNLSNSTNKTKFIDNTFSFLKDEVELGNELIKSHLWMEVFQDEESLDQFREKNPDLREDLLIHYYVLNKMEDITMSKISQDDTKSYIVEMCEDVIDVDELTTWLYEYGYID